MNATTIDMYIATGTLSAIGRMYGPIIPVISIIGRNDTIKGDDDRRAHFVHGFEYSLLGRLLEQTEVPEDVLHVHDRVIDDKAKRQDEENSVTRLIG